MQKNYVDMLCTGVDIDRIVLCLYYEYFDKFVFFLDYQNGTDLNIRKELTTECLRKAD